MPQIPFHPLPLTFPLYFRYASSKQQYTIFFWYEFFYIVINKTISLHLLWLIRFYFILILFNFLHSLGWLMRVFVCIFKWNIPNMQIRIETSIGIMNSMYPVPSFINLTLHICFKTTFCVNVYFIPLFLIFPLESINLITIYHGDSH